MSAMEIFCGLLYAVIFFIKISTLILTNTCSQVDDSQKRFNGETTSSKQTTFPSHYAPFVKEDEVNSQTSSVQSSNDVEGKEEGRAIQTTQTSSVTPVSRVAPQPKSVSPVTSTQQVSLEHIEV